MQAGGRAGGRAGGLGCHVDVRRRWVVLQSTRGEGFPFIMVGRLRRPLLLGVLLVVTFRVKTPPPPPLQHYATRARRNNGWPRQQSTYDKMCVSIGFCPFSLGRQVRSPPSLEIIERESAVDAVASPV